MTFHKLGLADDSFIVRVWMGKWTQSKIKSHYTCLLLFKHLFSFAWAALLSALRAYKGNGGTEPFLWKRRTVEGANTEFRHASCTVVLGRSITGALFMWTSSTSGFILQGVKMLESCYCADTVERSVNAQNLNLLIPLKRKYVQHLGTAVCH